MMTSSPSSRKPTGLAGGELEGIGAPPGELEQAAARVLRLAGDGAAAEQVAGLQVAAVRGVVRQELRRGPVEIGEAWSG